MALSDYIIIALFLGVTISIGVYFSRRAGQNIDNYFLGGRNLTWWVAGTSMVATTFAADTPLAVTELVAQNGIAGNWLWWNMLAGGMLTTFFFSRYWRRANILTDVELIKIRYSGKAAAFLRPFKALYIGIFLNALVMGWVNLALMSLLKVFFNIPDDQLVLYVGGALLLVALYVSMSGLLGVAYTDLFQFVISMTGSILLAIFVVNSDKIGGISGLKVALPQGALDFFPKIGSGGDSSPAEVLVLSIGSFLAFIGMQWWASWYPGAEPGGGGYIAQRMMSTKDEKHAIYSTLFFQIAHYCIRPWPWIIVALCTLVLYPELTAENQKLGYVMAMKDYLPAGLKGLLLVSFLAAYMSTISTQLNWGSSYIINDLYKNIAKNYSDKGLVKVARISTLVLMVVSLLVTTQIETISGVWTFIFESGAGVGLVLILRWYWWRINAWSEIIATIAPFIGYAITKYYFHWEFPDSFFFILGFSTVAWIVGTLLTKPTDNEKLKSFHELIKPQGNWKPFTNGAEKQSNLANVFWCWIFAIAMAYSILFFMGSVIFMEWLDALSYGVVGVSSFFLFRRFARKGKVFELKE
ncbi:MAG: Na+:solute symporter [Cytophagales bacterium]|nr:Na+:solute symporter [Cytophagales bacterium]